MLVLSHQDSPREIEILNKLLLLLLPLLLLLAASVINEVFGYTHTHTHGSKASSTKEVFGSAPEAVLVQVV
jgi:hypothetical protein